ncbi:MAG: 16S rRNA (adenine(1518)-N(6)/adenine(1519)-N(6))-dimethyltransferase RsmA [Eubacterium sp.]|nr:16S rRNA (adenine(1518)-N(6)/adenine(1519)-N(6))-dimethyltransferase RsmA [Eubacterium sp.]
MKLYEPSTIKLIKNKYGFRFSKSLGQNFLIDKAVLDSITDGAGLCKDDLVIEIGPGIGVLTQAAAEKAGKVVAVEIDEGLIEVLRFTLYGIENVKVINGNILKTDLKALIEQEKGDLLHVKVIGNLPYYITTAIIMKLLSDHIGCESITVMMQKEVGDRIMAAPGNREYGAISAAVQYYSIVNRISEVDKTSFMPQPKVDSCVLRMDILDTPAAAPEDEDHFFRVIRAAFGQRRKTLLNSLGSTGAPKSVLAEVLDKADIDKSRRAETLTLEEFARLSDELAQKGY